MNEYYFDITPCACPRMTSADRWNKRPIVQKYFAFRNHLRYQANLKSLETIPGTLNSLVFYLPMPQSWSKKKKEQMRGQPHQQTPDLDNLCKGFLDGLCSQDQHIHCIESMKKIWSDFGSIVLTIGQPEPQVESLSLFTNLTNRE